MRKATIEALGGGFPSPYLAYWYVDCRTQAYSVAWDANRPQPNVIVAPGSDTALLYAYDDVIEQGDEVLIPDPSYPVTM